MASIADPIKSEPVMQQCINWGIVSNLCVGILGPGLLCMPWAVEKAGIVGATILFLITCGLNLITSRFLLYLSNKNSKEPISVNVESPLLGRRKSSISEIHENSTIMYSSLEELAGEVLSPTYRIITAVSVIIFLAGCIVGNMIALKTATQALFHSFGGYMFPTFICIIYCISAFCNTEILGKYTSPAGLLALFIVSGCLCARTSFSNFDLVRPVSIMEAFPIATFAFTVQPYILGICAGSEGTSVVNENSLFVAFFICFTLYTSVGIVGYATFGNQVAPNVLTNFNSDDWLAILTNACMMIVIIACAPVNIFPVRHAIMELGQLRANNCGSFAYYIITAILVFIPYLMAIRGWDMATVFSITGNTACVLTCYFLPCIAIISQTKNWEDIIWPGTVCFISLVMSALAVF